MLQSIETWYHRYARIGNHHIHDHNVLRSEGPVERQTGFLHVSGQKEIYMDAKSQRIYICKNMGRQVY